MAKPILLIVFILYVGFLSAFTMSGDVKAWSLDDLISTDEIGDTDKLPGDISSVYAKQEDGNLYLRVTFDNMITRERSIVKTDNFRTTTLQLRVTLTSTQKQESLWQTTIPLQDTRWEQGDIKTLRTATSNLFEIAIPWDKPEKRTEITYTFEVLDGEKVIDSVKKTGTNRSGGGNCAFVHHGNQGLTYTEVLYGQYPQDSSGFDEVLEVHQATGVPGNFHMSGTLMPATEWHNPGFNDWLSQGVQQGWAAMMTSALGQHIMPFVQDNMNNWSVYTETQMVNYLYNYFPKVAWVPERVWLSQSQYPNAGVIDWIGDNWRNNGVEAVVLDDWPHGNGASNTKIHWMNNGSGINLRVIPINNDFVGKMHYDRDGAKNLIWNTGQYGIAVYGTDWEVAAEMNENHNTYRLDNYENVLWWAHDNYPAVNVWKLDSAINNADFNGTGIDIKPGTYGLLGSDQGYGGSNNSWYTIWAGTASHSDYHSPAWTYGYIWNDAYNNLMTAPNNGLAQLGWYTLMINLHETGWQEGGSVAGWEHRYSSHMKNANVYAEGARWAAGQYATTTAAYFSDIDHDGGNELVMYNDKVFAVFEGVGGKINWLFYKDGLGGGYSVVSSDMAYWSETDGDYNESSNNHVAALSEVSPNQQGAIYQVNIDQGTGNTVQATLTQWGVKKTIRLETGKNYLDTFYDFYNQTGYIRSGWSPDLLDLLWSGKSHLQRLYGDWGGYAGYRNSSHGATVAMVFGSGGGSQQSTFEGTLVIGDEVKGTNVFGMRLFAGYTSAPTGTRVSELDALAAQTSDMIAPKLTSGWIVGSNKIQLVFNENITSATATNSSNYTLSGFTGTHHVTQAILTHSRRVVLTVDTPFAEGETGTVVVSSVTDAANNPIDSNNNQLLVQAAILPHIVFNNGNAANHNNDLVLRDDGSWRADINLTAGSYTYKVYETNAEDGNSWPATAGSFTITSSRTMTFYANCGVSLGLKEGNEFITHFEPQVSGDFLSELGGTDWSANDSRGKMADSNTDGIWSWQNVVPAGDWQVKIALNRNFNQITSGTNYWFHSDGAHATNIDYRMMDNTVVITSSGAFYPPTSLTATQQATKIFLQWQAPVATGLSGYKLYRNNQLLATLTQPTYTDSVITNATVYKYAVSAIYTNPVGESSKTDSVAITYIAPPELISVQFLPDAQSDYTNFTPGATLSNGSPLQFEICLNPAYTDTLSQFSAKLVYHKAGGAWTEKSFVWNNNFGEKSYWRAILANGADVQNGDQITFYVTARDYNGPLMQDTNSGLNYTVNLQPSNTQQAVTVLFQVDMNHVTHTSQVYLAGDFTSWGDNKLLLTDSDADGVYTGTKLFASGSVYTHEYKFINGTAWEDHYIGNRKFTINDSGASQTLDLVYFNNIAPTELTTIQFLPDSLSEYTNFNPSGTLSSGSSAQIEIRLSDADVLANSSHGAKLYFKRGINESWQQKTFAWSNNYLAASYWRQTLVNGTDIQNGDTLYFYVEGTDYNGPVVRDDNNGQYYKLRIRSNATLQAVTAIFTVNMNVTVHSDSVWLAGDFTGWGTSRIRMQDPEHDGIYTCSYLFPAGSTYTHEYKFMNGDAFETRLLTNRSIEIDDGAATQTMAMAHFNNIVPVQLQAVRFMPYFNSLYTNFNNGAILPDSSAVLIEAEMSPADLEAVSAYSITLHYQLDGGAWQEKSFLWNNNYGGNSFWHCSFAYPTDIDNGQTITFYITANDWDGPELIDNNEGANYTVQMGQMQYLATPSALTIQADGEDIVLTWQAVDNAKTYIVEVADSSTGTFQEVARAGNAMYRHVGGALLTKRFYRIVASSQSIAK